MPNRRASAIISPVRSPGPVDTDMIKRYLLLAAALAAGGLAAAPAGAYSWDPPEKRSFLIKGRLKYWFAASSAETRTYITTPSDWWIPQADHVDMGRTDEYTGMDASFPLVSAEVQPVNGLSLELEAGRNSFNGGKLREHAWLHADNTTLYLLNGVTWVNPQQKDFSLSEARLTGTAAQYSATLYARIYRNRLRPLQDEGEAAHSIDLFAGYTRYTVKTNITAGYQVLSTDFFLPTTPEGPYSGLNSSSELTWSGWRVGLRQQSSFSKDFSMEGKVSYGPGVKFYSSSHWNLHTDLKNPGVLLTAHGPLLELSASAAWRIWRDLEAEGGYLYWRYQASSGGEVFRFTDGTTEEQKVDKIVSVRKGFFFALNWKY